ncbi:cytochrome P450 [Nocardia asteroides]|uniref:cytochrome P450 n=1 Tax=Nocardia asteroides TaxID=1824 RepID=UPI00342592FE
MIINWNVVAERVFISVEWFSRSLPQKPSGLPPGPRMPSSLQTFWWLIWPNPFLELCRRRFGTRFTLDLLTQAPMVFLSDPAEVKELMKAAPDDILPGAGGSILRTALGDKSIITLDGEEHLEHRRLMAPAFHGAKIERLVPLMESVTDRYLALMPRGRQFAIHSDLQSLTMEIILRATFGSMEQARLSRLRELIRRAIEFAESPLFALPATRTMPAIRWGWIAFNDNQRRIDEEIYLIIGERREARASHRDDADGADLLSVLLDARHDSGSALSDAEIRDELLTMVVAGHETTASQLSWALLLLARNPAVQQSLHRQLVAGEDGGHDYLQATLQECLRSDMATPHPEPRVVAHPVTIGGIDYPPGVTLQAHGHLLHHDPMVYPDPGAFRPERFLQSRPVPYSWIPFGGGRRRCIGSNLAMLEMQVVLRKVVMQCEIRPVGPGVERGKRRAITSSPARGALIELVDRPQPVGASRVGLAASADLARRPVAES